MNDEEKDLLLTRLDMKTDSILDIQKEQARHLARINGQIIEEAKKRAVNTTTLFGVDGHSGLMGKVDKIEDSTSKLSRNFFIVFGILIGSGIITGSIYGIQSIVN